MDAASSVGPLYNARMETASVQALRQLNLAFYENYHESFSKTRQAAWPGWGRIVASLPDRPLSVLDMACGNLRFKACLDQAHVDTTGRYYALDSCSDLLPERHGTSFQQLDIVGSLIGGDLTSRIHAPACDLAVCFGFMHHVPTAELRMRLLAALLEKTSAGGIAALSFWQFALDDRMLAKAKASTERARRSLSIDLAENDYLLGWGDVDGAYRYCHSFTDGEIEELATAAGQRAVRIDRFKADGRANALNGYLVFHLR